MDYEKAYNEAIKRAKAIIEVAEKEEEVYKSAITIFPELRESEDERIRQKFIKLVKMSNEVGGFALHKWEADEMLAWLEKQGEQKSIWHNEYEEPQRDSLILLIMQSGTPIVAKIIEPNHTFNHGEKWAYIDDLLEKQGNLKSDEWKEGDVVRHGGVLALVTNGRRAIKSNLEQITIQYPDEWVKAETKERKYFFDELEKQDKQQPAEWSEEDDSMICELIHYLNYRNEQGDFHADLIRDWVVSLKDRTQSVKMKELLRTEYEKGRADVISEMKSSWSEEDEDTLAAIIAIIRKQYNGTNIEEKKYYNVLINWLKSLKDRYTWKPSDEQMKALKYVAYHLMPDNNYREEMFSLYEDLKKLKA